MPSKMIVVGSSSQGYKTASEYLTKTNLGSAAMAFFPHIKPHLIRDSLESIGKPFEPISNGIILSPGTFYIGTRNNFEVSPCGYSMGLSQKFSIEDDGNIKNIIMDAQRTSKPIDDHFMAVYDSFGENTICVILRGSGDDGVDSAKYIHDNGGHVIISSLRGGMTMSAKYAISDAEVLDPEDIPDRLEELINS